jgi:hypothetical protein
MAGYTVRTFHANGQWVKVTRDKINREYFFARGYEGDDCASDVGKAPFKRIKNWADVIYCVIKIMRKS